MKQFRTINVADAKQKIASQEAVMVDIRDAMSFSRGRPANAFHLTQDSLTDFIEDTPTQTPVIVICYHGHSSQGAAQYLIGQGFEDVYSLDGGFEAWRRSAPVDGDC